MEKPKIFFSNIPLFRHFYLGNNKFRKTSAVSYFKVDKNDNRIEDNVEVKKDFLVDGIDLTQWVDISLSVPAVANYKEEELIESNFTIDFSEHPKDKCLLCGKTKIPLLGIDADSYILKICQDCLNKNFEHFTNSLLWYKIANNPEVWKIEE